MQTTLPVPLLRQAGWWVPAEERQKTLAYAGNYGAEVASVPSRHVLDFGEVPAAEVWSVERIYAQTEHGVEWVEDDPSLRLFVLDDLPAASGPVLRASAPHILDRAVPSGDALGAWHVFDPKNPIRLQEQQRLVVVFEGTRLLTEAAPSPLNPAGSPGPRTLVRAQLTILRRG